MKAVDIVIMTLARGTFRRYLSKVDPISAQSRLAVTNEMAFKQSYPINGHCIIAACSDRSIT